MTPDDLVIEERPAGEPPEGVDELPDVRWLVARREGEPLARLGMTLADGLRGAPGLTGMVGHYQARDGAAGVALLRRACRLLAREGVGRVLGPMDGSTWGRYRLALPPDPGEDAPPWFFLEPRNPPDYPAQFREAGFTVAARYESRLVPDLAAPRPGTDLLAARVERAGIRVRPLAPAHFEEALRVLFAFSETAFTGNPYYRPIDYAAFRAGYLRLGPAIDPDLVLLAEDGEGATAGFLFAVPDREHAGEGRRIIVKTVAASPRWRGLGTHLVDRVHARARERGYGAAIHALMWEGNPSLRISLRWGSCPYRRYALYEWRPA